MASNFSDPDKNRSFKEVASSFLTGHGAGALILGGAAFAVIYQAVSHLGMNVLVSMLVALAATLTLARAASSHSFQEAKKNFLLHLSWKPLMTIMGAAALTLTTAAFFTTWKGMSDFTGDWWRSLLITTGVQVLMIALALLIGNIAASESVQAGGAPLRAAKDRRTGRSANPRMERATFGALSMVAAFAVVVVLFQFKVLGGLALIGVLALAILIGVIIAARQHVIVALSFMLAMSISTFFTFDALYSTISPEEKRSRDALILARSEVQDIFGTLSERFAEERKRLQDNLIESETWGDFSKRLAAVQAVASESDKIIEDIEIERRAVKDADLRKLRDDFEISQKSIPTLETEKAQIDNQLKSLQDERAPLAAKVEELRQAYEKTNDQVKEITNRLNSEQRDGQGARKSGCGPECRKIKEELRPFESQTKREKERLDIEEKILKDIDKRFADLNRRSGTIAPELDRRKREAATAGSRVQQAEGATAEDEPNSKVDQTGLAGFNVALKTFPEKPTRDGFQALVSTCDGILTTMRSLPQLKDKTAALDCDPKGFSSDITLFIARTSAMDAFNGECSRDAVSEIAQTPSAHVSQKALTKLPTAEERQLAALNQTGERNKAFAGLLDAGNKCLSHAYKASPGSTAAQRDRVDSLALSIDPEAHRFQRNLAVLDRGDKTAFLAAIIAFALDALVFASGLYWARTSIPPITRRGEASPDQMKSIIDVNLDVDPDIYGREPPGVLNAKIFLHYLRRDFAGFRGSEQNMKGKFSGVVDLKDVSDQHRPYVDKVLDVGDFCQPIDGAHECFLVQRRLVDYLNEQIWKWQVMNPRMKPRAPEAGEEADAPIFDGETANGRRWSSGLTGGARNEAWMADGLANDGALDDYFGLEQPLSKTGHANGQTRAEQTGGPRPRPSPGLGRRSIADQVDDDPAMQPTPERNDGRAGVLWNLFRMR